MSKGTRTGGRPAVGGVIAGRIALSIGMPDIAEPAGFKWTALTDVARLESGHTPSRSHPEYWDGAIPWIGVRDATGNHGQVINETIQHVTQAGIDNSSARILPAGTVCLSRTASVGYVVTMGKPMATSQDFVNWVCGPELDRRYLHYLLMLEQDSIRRFAYGSVHMTMYFPEAKALHVLLPSAGEQRAIAEVLGALDDKIAANRRILEHADALVRSRYARVVALTDRVVPLSDVASNIRRQVRPEDIEPDSTYVGMEHVPRRQMWIETTGIGSDATSAKAAFEVGDVLFGKLRPYFHKVAYAPTAGVCSTDILVVRAKDRALRGLVLGACTADETVAAAVAASEGTRMPRAKWADIAVVPVPDPESTAVREFSADVVECAEAMSAHVMENERLAATRDALLPLLMSGKVRVKDVEREVEELV